ncbi:MAG: DMT family protein [Bacteroidota bacterium]|nr:DMT family protein [Bacteroidota bacterium]
MWKTILLLVVSNVFMTFAWYGHLKFQHVALWKVILISWLIAFVEYLFMVPANRIGKLEGMNGYQLKIIQESITIVVFIIFAVYYLKEPLKWNHIVGFVLLFFSVFFIVKKF